MDRLVKMSQKVSDNTTNIEILDIISDVVDQILDQIFEKILFQIQNGNKL